MYVGGRREVFKLKLDLGFFLQGGNISYVVYLKKSGCIREESNSTEKPPWSAHLDYERSHSRLRVATGLARGSRKTKTTFDMRTVEQKQGSQKSFSANIFSFFSGTTFSFLGSVGGVRWWNDRVSNFFALLFFRL